MVTRAPYANQHVYLTTKHAKSRAIGPVFAERLGADVREYRFDTDTLGTFSREIERTGTALDAARRKVQQAFIDLDAELALASEGSFGPHPAAGFMPADRELLYFVDRPRDFTLTESLTTTETNYRMAEVATLQELSGFAQAAGFPSHGLILATRQQGAPQRMIKGIQNKATLVREFVALQQDCAERRVWVETDMRASCNPTRMSTIAKLARTLAQRLDTPCPACGLPGWGRVAVIEGLPCAWCGSPTRLPRAIIHGCVKCDHRACGDRPDGLKTADPAHCPACNP